MKVLGHKRDSRPVSSLERKSLSSDMLIGGAVTMVLAHLAVPGAVFLVTSILAATGLASHEPQRYIEERVVEARFVQKGIKRDPDKLPDRKVPRKTTAPDDAKVVSKNMNPEPPEKPKEKKPERAEEDLLTRLGDRAQQFAEIAEEREKEGDPDGIEEGTSTEAQAGDLYVGQLYAFFKRNWTIPNTISDPTKFVAHAEVEITRDLHIGDFSIVKESGEPLFDQSVEDVLNKLRSDRATVPEPPPEIAYKFVGQKIVLRFKGK